MWFPLMKDCSQINLGKVTELGGLSLHIESVISDKCPYRTQIVNEPIRSLVYCHDFLRYQVTDLISYDITDSL